MYEILARSYKTKAALLKHKKKLAVCQPTLLKCVLHDLALTLPWKELKNNTKNFKRIKRSLQFNTDLLLFF